MCNLFISRNRITRNFTILDPTCFVESPIQQILSEHHVALDRNQGPGYNTLLLTLLIPGDLLSACPHRQFHTLPSLLDSRAVLSNSYPNTCVQCREAVCTIFMMVFGMTLPGQEPTTYRVRGGHANH